MNTIANYSKANLVAVVKSIVLVKIKDPLICFIRVNQFVTSRMALIIVRLQLDLTHIRASLCIIQ